MSRRDWGGDQRGRGRGRQLRFVPESVLSSSSCSPNTTASCSPSPLSLCDLVCRMTQRPTRGSQKQIVKNGSGHQDRPPERDWRTLVQAGGQSKTFQPACSRESLDTKPWCGLASSPGSAIIDSPGRSRHASDGEQRDGSSNVAHLRGLRQDRRPSTDLFPIFYGNPSATALGR